MLSNVIHHKGRTNFLLNKWISTHKFRVVEIRNIGSKNQRDEILVMNYDWRTL
jgi:adenine-specific DNA-methyltransferase